MQHKAAKAWGKTPSEWKLLGKEDKVIMMAFDRAEGIIESWHMEEAEKRVKIGKKTRTDRRQPRKHTDKRRQ